MNHKKEFLISLAFVCVLGSATAYFLFDENNPVKSILFSYVGFFSIFFVPYLFKNSVKKKQVNKF